MHVVTFYSYKGGVGRTMALVNTAAVLALRGRKVLIVDFDLEAPGISTYSPFSGLTNAKGVVEYVSEYIESAIAPKVREFIVESKLGSASVWAMPAGKRDREYSTRLNSIDWQALYAVQSGYLFFEDLKQQWREQEFDYVLIDSRTGHTDVGGICTRQLPDAVLLMFFPNDQNLLGLETVVRDIRDEPNGLRTKDIILHFCASNVPDLDDEDHILERKLKEARQRLDYKRANPVQIHHYNSLTLLEQSVFVLDRPESKLATEYKRLVDSIVFRNLEDAQGAVSVLQKLRDGLRQNWREDLAEFPIGKTIKKTLDEIRDLHPKNGEIAWMMAHIYSVIGDLGSETRSLTVAIDANFNATTARRRRAAIARLQGRQDDALLDLQAIISNPETSGVEFVAAVELLPDFDSGLLETIAHSPLLKKLDAEQSIRLAEILSSDLRGIELTLVMMRQLMLQVANDSALYAAAKVRLVLSLISSNQFEAAMTETASDRKEVLRSKDIVSVFNYGMAEWGHQGSPSPDIMSHVIELASPQEVNNTNRHQCLALANYVCNNNAVAREELEKARTLSSHWDGRQFSCWRYLEVDRSQMRDDLNAMELFFNGALSGPAVFFRSSGGAVDPRLLN
jgi:cellulose biosynthesis protein BcsQ